MASILIFGYGNPSRGDDALGPRLVESLAKGWAGQIGGEVEFLTDFQLQIEHALDLTGRCLVIFADAHQSCVPPFSFNRLAEAQDRSYTTHSMSPAAILHVYRNVCGAAPPPTFLLSIRGQRFELGEEMSAAARSHLDAAIGFTNQLLEHPDAAAWQARTTPMELEPA